MKNFKHYTTYKIATHWCNNSLVLCNNIAEIDESIFENARFDMYDEESDSYMDIFQYFITDCSESEVEFLEKNFGLLFTYSEKLDCFVLCVDHCGTGWDYVSCGVSDGLIKIWGDKIEYKDSCNPPMIKTTKTFVEGGKK